MAAGIMNAVWVDTDFGFDDLWALLLLRHLECPVAGVSLVAGNAPLAQVTANAMGAIDAYGFDWPVWQGADAPLKRTQETAQRVLGSSGMQSRGQSLPQSQRPDPPGGALVALQNWLLEDGAAGREILALGPLTNIAQLLHAAPHLKERIARLVWMGGSAGRGNHTPLAEFNAVADAEAADVVLSSGVPLDIVDLEFCRQHSFGPDDMPKADVLTGDLLGGYLDIALQRGRAGMAIYDPLAALAIAAPDHIGFEPCDVAVSTEADETYGATTVTTGQTGTTRIARTARADLSRICLNALKKEAEDGPGQ